VHSDDEDERIRKYDNSRNGGTARMYYHQTDDMHLYMDPYPLSENVFLVAHNPDKSWNDMRAYGLYPHEKRQWHQPHCRAYHRSPVDQQLCLWNPRLEEETEEIEPRRRNDEHVF